MRKIQFFNTFKQWKWLFLGVLLLSMLSRKHNPFCEHNHKGNYPTRARFFGISQQPGITPNVLADSVYLNPQTARE
jgi:hypothetical protein